MNIDKVILASNENKDYLEFWPLVSEAWERIGVEPVLIYTGNDEINLNGHIINFHIKGIDSTFVAQNIRLLAPALFKDENCIISDIDSLPLSSKYFQNSVRDNLVWPELWTFCPFLAFPVPSLAPFWLFHRRN